MVLLRRYYIVTMCHVKRALRTFECNCVLAFYWHRPVAVHICLVFYPTFAFGMVNLELDVSTEGEQ